MGERRGQSDGEERGPVGTALATSIRGNSTAFGFSITITVAFGALQRLEGSPDLAQLLFYGLGAAVVIGLLEGAITGGFRARVGIAPPEVRMLGTALDVFSIAAGVGAAIGAGELTGASVAWPLGGAVAAGVYILADSAEVLFAEWLQGRRGNPDAERAEDGGGDDV